MPKTIQKITYIKDNQESSEREVIIFSKPNTNFITIEVTELSEDDRAALLDMLTRQEEELKTLKPAWKSLKAEGVTFV